MTGPDGPAPLTGGRIQALEAGVRRFESAIYLAVAALLIVAAIFTLVGTVIDLIEGSDSRQIADAGTFLLDRVLLLFIIAELLYTLRAVNLGGRIMVEPFLFVALIAVVRKVLVVTAEAQGTGAKTGDVLVQTAALGGLALVLTLSIHLLRRSSGGPGWRPPAGAGRRRPARVAGRDARARGS